jgi:hypothetical protein
MTAVLWGHRARAHFYARTYPDRSGVGGKADRSRASFDPALKATYHTIENDNNEAP